MTNPLLMIKNKNNIGIPSYCTANELVIEAILEQGRNVDEPVLIEGTSNQINQFGGYTGMTPKDFRDYVFNIADNICYVLL